jgi:hypothetical protein
VNVALWVAAIIAGSMSFGAAMNKLLVPKDKILQQGKSFQWVEDFSSSQLKAIGAVEALGAVGVIVPQATGVAEILTPIAAIGLVLLQIGAMATHLRRKERQPLPINLLLIGLLAFVAVGRFANG